ncbi:hypothetical protein KZO01_24160 [Kurthia zopfii]|uniref:Superfamily II helicase and inactivated derivatives n=1 Tax=Kurthia zopfii TaxID=1650 RepID=A0A8B4QE15_9BACL|nr:DUF927 domain-containing protein [Kurthia zopfii]PWI22728.1 hypothetical protein DF281_06040 [Kurthia zopfii]TDR39529.1 uncharacterized protein (DUF927 family) [Kurthia zopfii]GEK32107.1 hypothetical protein KZO01_24160 [Kurthia zopfii]STX10838.1 Superfamily II helicase and inactivated derivatives [Kurthia zopfii]
MTYETFFEEVKGFGIPDPFFTKENKLYKINSKNGDEEFISRHVPYITMCFDDIERNNIQYELKWFNDDKIYNEVVPATALATKREVIELANKGLSSNDRNARPLIEYFDLFLEKNKLKRSLVVSHIGYVGNHFIHPQMESKFRVVPPDEGELQRLRAVQCSGSVEGWIKNVLEPLYDNPKALFPVIASFASVLFKEYDLTPIVVDISGISSSGKTTVQKVCASVWGMPSGYISSMLTTKIAIERMASFLNAFPLILDDTNTAHDTKALQQIIYMFGNGTGKMRGSLEGSRGTSSWQSVFITTGENNILEYTNSQGSAARVIPITNFKFVNKKADYFTALNQNVEQYYGSVGLEFLKRWKHHSKRFYGRFKKLMEFYQEDAGSNNVMRRIALHYAFIVFVGEVLNELFREEGIKIPINDFTELFLTMCSDNDHVDRAKNVLIEVLEELDANRSHIYGEYEPNNGIHAIVNCNGLFLTVDYVNKRLGVDAKQIREAWKTQQHTVEQKNKGKSVDYKNITHKKQTFRVAQVNQDFLEEQGFNFSRNCF